MTRFVTRALFVVAATLGIVFAQVVPASATVHEIVGQWCSGQEPLGPPGITPPTAKPNNVAKPLSASGFVTGELDPFTGDAGDGFLVVVNYDNPNAKVVGTGDFFVIGEIDGKPLYLEGITPDLNFPAFKQCPRLVTG